MKLKIDKLASDDASRWAYAEMFFGEGAGTRRKLLSAEIQQKMVSVPGYGELFQKYYEQQDFVKHAEKATKERKVLNRRAKTGKNFRALARGDRRGMSNGFAAFVIVGSVAVATGYDKKIYAYSKKKYGEAKVKVQKFLNENDTTKPANIRPFNQER